MQKEIQLYDFTNYREYLKDVLVRKIEINSKYSLRAMALSLDMGASTLSEVLSGRRNLSVSHARKIAARLKLKNKEVLYFCDLVQLDGAKDPEIKQQIIDRLHTVHPKGKKVSDLNVDLFRQMSDWYHSAILELPLINGFVMSSENAAKALNISKHQADQAIERLIKLGLFEKSEDGTLTRQDISYKVQSDIKNSAMRQYYRQMLDKVSSALEEQTPKERISGYMNVPINLKALPEIDQAIDRLFADISLINAKYKDQSDIYHLSLHFFNLTKTKGK